MNIETEVSRFIPRKNIVYSPQTLEKAAEAGSEYEISKISKDHYACETGEGTGYVIIKQGDSFGCSCAACTFNRGGGKNDGCKHIVVFLKRIDSGGVIKQQPSAEMLAALKDVGWTGLELKPPQQTSDPSGEDGEGSDPTPEEPPEHPAVPAPGLKESAGTDVTMNELDVPIEPQEQQQEAQKMEPNTTATQAEQKTGSAFDWIESLIEYGVGQVFGDTGAGKTAFCRELAEQAADEGKKVIYWDSEGNMTRAQQAAMKEHKNIEYILDRSWEDIRHMLPVTGEDTRSGQSIYAKTPKLKKCDLFILDSIGVPVLGIYGDLKQNQKGEALQGMQGLVYRLGAWAEKNDAVTIITNQPVSEMNKTEAQKADRHPFGDKAMFFTKEILKIIVGERTEYKTVCHLLAWRSRSAGRNKMLGTVTISDNGVEIAPGVV